MSIITENFAKIAQLQEAMQAEQKKLQQREKFLLAQIDANLPKSGHHAIELAGVRVLLERLPVWMKDRQAEIYKLNSEIEQQKNQ